MRALLTAALICLLPLTAVAASPSAIGGVIDLSSWDLATRVVSLGGEWDFYWKKLLSPEDFAENRILERPGTINVPGAWNGYEIQAGPAPGHGFATYRLNVILGEAPGPLSLYIPYLQTAYRLWINGRLVGANGTIADESGESTPEYRPVIARADPRDGKLEIVLQVANSHHRVGGMWNAPILSAESRFDQWFATRLITTAFMVGVFVFVAVYHVVIYVLRRDAKGHVYLSLLGLCIATRTLLMGDHLADWLFPSLSWEAGLKAEYIAGYIGPTAYALFQASAFPRETPRWLTRSILVFNTAGVLLTLVAPGRITSQLVPLMIYADTAMIASYVWVAVRALKRKRRGAGVLLIGGGVLVVTILYDFLFYNRIIGSINLTPFGYCALVVAQGYLLGEEYARTYRRQGRLLQELERSRGIIGGLHQRERRAVAEFLHSHVQSRLIVIDHKFGKAIDLVTAQAKGVALIEVNGPQVAEPHDDALRAAELLGEVRSEIASVREDDIRKASHLLHPSVVDLGLIAAVQSLAAKYKDVFEVTFAADDEVAVMDRRSILGTLRSSEAKGAGIFSSTLRLTVYRFIEECLANVHKHASANRAEICIRLADDGMLDVSVSDDGKGVAPERFVWGLGLKVADAMVSQAGGRLTITRREPNGTTVRAVLPLANE